MTARALVSVMTALLLTTHGAAADESIEDPLSTAPKQPSPAKDASSGPDFHLDVWNRNWIDTHWSRDPVAPALSEDVVRSFLRTTIGVVSGSPTGIRYRLEVRLDLEARAKKGLERPTWLYDAIPLAAYLELPFGDRVRARIGEQVVSWGRLDLASAADVLERRDLRSGPTLDPSWSRLPTATVRIDAHLARALDATIAWTVVSRPHRFDLLGSSWALIGPGVIATANNRAFLQRVSTSSDASTYIRVQDAFLQASTPAPRIDGGEIAARATAHLGGVDLALTYGYVRSKLPVITVDRALIDVGTTGDLLSGVRLVSALEEGRPLITTSYPYYHQLALDLEGTAGPFTISWELGFTPRRPLFVSGEGGFPTRRDSGLVQAGVRLQYLRGETFVATAEVDAIETTTPSDQPYLLFGPRRTFLAALVTARKEIDRKHVLEIASLMTSSGPSLQIMPRYAYELNAAWTIGVAAAWFPKLKSASASSGPTLADVQIGRDYGELFVRYRR